MTMPTFLTECVYCGGVRFDMTETRHLDGSVDPTTGELWTRPLPALTTMRITCAECSTEVDASAFTRILPI